MSDEVVDLDVLRPPVRKIVLDKKVIDVSFVPCAITWEVDRLTREIFGFDVEEAQKGGEETKKVFDLTLELCATFCANQYPEMTVDWFKKFTSPDQVKVLSDQIVATLQLAFKGAEAYQGN